VIGEATRATWDRMIADLQEFVDLTEWENEFVDSLSIQRSESRDLSFRQSKTLRELATRKGVA